MAVEAAPAGEAVVQGYCAPEHLSLREAFQRNFTERGEIGASFAVTIGGETVADLWGGYRDPAATVPWERDTIAGVWSASKGVAALCFAMLIDRGLASYDDKVSRYWPEFAVAGKQDLTLGLLMSHQSGITGFTTPASLEDLMSDEVAAARLARQAPLWEPGTGAGYGGMTIGVLTTALFRRIEGRTLKQFVADEIAAAFDLDISIGLAEKDRPRVADLIAGEAIDASRIPATNAARKALHNPPMRGDLPNSPAFQAADLSSGNGFGNARGLACMYALMLNPGKDGRRILGSAALAEATRCWFEGVDFVRGPGTRWAAGFLLNSEHWGPDPETFGMGGWGGAFGLADPVKGVTIGYVMNHMSDLMDANPRRKSLIEAVFAAV